MKNVFLVFTFFPVNIHTVFPQKNYASDFSAGFDAMSKIDQLPLLHTFGTNTKQFISYDVTGVCKLARNKTTKTDQITGNLPGSGF